MGLLGNALALTDPTRPTDPATYFGTGNAAHASGWTLQSILFGSDRRVAVINGTRVQEGDRIGSARVVRIRDSQVLLDTGGRSLTLHLLPETVKVRP
jgi:MSHA biogenesis protein MshK